MKKILVFLADGFEEIEAVTVIDILRRSNVRVDICSLEGDLVRGVHDIYIKSDIQIEDKLQDYDGIYLPGGMPGAKNLMEHPRVQELITHYHSKGKLVSAICAAPIALNKAGILKGQTVTSFPTFENELDDVIYIDKPIVVSNNIITSRGPGTSFSTGFAILEYLGYINEAEELKEDMQFNFFIENINKN